MVKLIERYLTNPTAKPMNVKVYIRINRATDGEVSSVTFVYRLSDRDQAEDIADPWKVTGYAITVLEKPR